MRTFITAAVFASCVSIVSAQQAPPASAPPQQRPATAPPSSPQGLPARPGTPVPGQPPRMTPPQSGRPSTATPAAPPAAPAAQRGSANPPAQAPARPGVTPGASTPGPAGPQQAYVWQNLKIDVKITDSQTSDSSTSKTVSLFCADGRKGQVRSNSDQGLINVDAQPTIRPDGKIHLTLTVEYRPSNIVAFSESLDVMVVDGRPLVLSQSADARSDRKVSVEVTATIVK